jgi:DNA-binding response OmpR family regulator
VSPLVEVDGGAARVAVLDDDRDAALSIAAVFRVAHMRAVAFTDAELLVVGSQWDRFDAFVLDWSIGCGSAEPVVRRLRMQDCYLDAPIFLLSGSVTIDGSPSDPALARAIGEHRLEFRVKPFSLHRLASQIIAATGQSPSEQHGGSARRFTGRRKGAAHRT